MKHLPNIQTSRLTLRPFNITDAPVIRKLAGDRAVIDTTLNIPYPYEEGMAEIWIATHQPGFKQGKSAIFAIVETSRGELIGAIGLEITQRFDRAELGYWIGKPWWNQGFCTEAARAVLQFGFETLRLNRIHASHFSRNPASGKVMLKLGMIHEGRARQHVKKWDVYEDMEIYGILHKEWLSKNKS